MEVTVLVTYAEPVDFPTTTEPLRSQSIIVPHDDETGAYICGDLADFCDYGSDDGQDLPDEFEWEE